MTNIRQLLKGDTLEWYQAERNTADLLRSVVASRDAETLSGDDIWRLMQLTWITTNGHDVSPNHWKKLKVPALAGLFGKHPGIRDDLETAIRAMDLPPSVEKAAIRETGVVNFRRVWRNSARTWCRKNRDSLRSIIRGIAIPRSVSDEERMALAAQIEALPRIESPNHKVDARAVLAVSPLVAFLDPQHRFPIINGRENVTKLLSKLGLTTSGLEDQVRHLTGLIGKWGIDDALLIDVFPEKVAELATAPPPSASRNTGQGSTKPLPDYDEEERIATQKAGKIHYRNRHHKMTTALKRIFAGFVLTARYDPECKYDVLIENYDQKGRSLLIEAKPDPDKAAIRIAIGQLLDYRRFLERPAAADAAVLTISSPSRSHIDLLNELQITAIWYTDESCTKLRGSGRAWPAIRTIQSEQITRRR